MKLILKLAPLPKIDQCKRVVFVGPHPDDIEIGAGGLVSKLIRKGAEVYFLICLDGACGSKDKNAKFEDVAMVRKQEALASAKFLGVKDVIFLNYPDGGKYEVSDLRVEIAKVLIDIKPDLVVCPSPHLRTETHMDHLRVANATRTALLISEYPLVAKRQGIEIENIYEFAKEMTLAYYFSDKNNQVVKINKTDFQNKINALMYHKSQPDAYEENVRKYLRFNAFTFGIKKFGLYGEGYYVLGPLHQHCFSENI